MGYTVQRGAGNIFDRIKDFDKAIHAIENALAYGITFEVEGAKINIKPPPGEHDPVETKIFSKTVMQQKDAAKMIMLHANLVADTLSKEIDRLSDESQDNLHQLDLCARLDTVLKKLKHKESNDNGIQKILV